MKYIVMDISKREVPLMMAARDFTRPKLLPPGRVIAIAWATGRQRDHGIT